MKSLLFNKAKDYHRNLQWKSQIKNKETSMMAAQGHRQYGEKDAFDKFSLQSELLES